MAGHAAGADVFRRACSALLWMAVLTGVSVGQGIAVPNAPEVGAEGDHARELSLPTLHVYTNLIQIPVLVLSNQRMPVRRVAEDRFLVSLDAGPRFKPAHVREEGDDPIALSILLDPGGSATEMVRSMKDLLAKLAPVDLLPHDRVSVYVISCKLMRTSLNIPANRTLVQVAMEHAWTEAQRMQGRHGCQQTVGLWDAMAMVAQQTATLPGRRVMLAATDGVDHGSVASWEHLRMLLQGAGIAVFGLTSMETGSVSSWGAGGRGGGPRGGIPGGSLGTVSAGTGHLQDEALFDAICELTGGMRIFIKETDLAYELKLLTRLLRERYIVEFPRPLKGMSGEHEIAVTIAKTSLFIRPSGVSVPIPDPKIAADSMTLPPDPTKAPEFGERRILQPKP